MQLSRRNGIKSVIALALLLLIIFGVVRALSARKAQQLALSAAAAAKDQALVELVVTDVVQAKMLDVLQGLPVSGTLKAINSAVIKARVSGELQGLALREGDYVKAGQVIARVEASEYQSRVRQAREQAESAKAQVDLVQRQYDNNKALVDQGFISKTALDASLANLNAAQSTYRAAQAATDVTGKSLADTVLKSPISGQVSQRLAQPGERVGVDSKIIEVVDLSRLELEVSLSAADAAQVAVGQSAELKIEGASQPASAKVARINPSAQAGSRSVLAYLSLDNAPSGNALPLRQGLFAQGRLGTARAQLLAVPLSCVRTDKPAPYVVVIENGKVLHRTVELGTRGMANGENVVAVQGLVEGTQVVRASVGYLREGTMVRFTQIAAPQTAVAAPLASSLAPAAGTATGANAP